MPFFEDLIAQMSWTGCQTFSTKINKNICSVKTNLKALLGLSHQLSLFKRLAIPNISRRKRYVIRPHVTQGRMATPSQPIATCSHFKSLGKSRLIPCIKELYVVREHVTDGIIWIARMYLCVWHSDFLSIGPFKLYQHKILLL